MAGRVLERKRGAGRPPGPLGGLASVLHSTVGMLKRKTTIVSIEFLSTFCCADSFPTKEVKKMNEKLSFEICSSVNFTTIQQE